MNKKIIKSEKQPLLFLSVLFIVLTICSCNISNSESHSQERTNRVFLVEIDNSNLLTNLEAADTLLKRYERLYHNKYCFVNKETNEMKVVNDWADIEKDIQYNDILLIKVVPKFNPLSLVYDVKRKLTLKFRMEGSNFLHIDASITKYKQNKIVETSELTGGRLYPEDPDRLIHFYLSLYMKLGVRDFM
ncbi:MAG: hypothetical protein MUE72_13165 [Chitinophagaceae bacterium]|jgi:hypothetical protein|nr:hypothetical protein [Chitinophagaceae bacterium]MCU0384220.1 hypothetical protein [Cyclobacteriaceae bacterium]